MDEIFKLKIEVYYKVDYQYLNSDVMVKLFPLTINLNS